MKHCLLSLLLLMSAYTYAQFDNFSVKVHDKTHLKTKGEYSQKVLFPINDKKISHITMNLTLNCPEGGCSDWDYSISVLLRTTKKGDTVNFQLGRMITPYSGAYNQGDNAKSWSPNWEWDISNYLPLMKDSVDIVVVYEGYQDGFLATTDFVFYSKEYFFKGQKNNTIKTQNIHYGYFPYGNIEKPIDDYVTPKEIVLPKGTKKVYARVMISGHGADSTNAAAEFLKKDFYYKVNGQKIATQAIWKDNCGCNPIQPQGGTWIYNRAGWCPGTVVNEYLYDLTPYIKGKKAKVDIDFEYYKTPQIEQPGYHVSHDIFFLKSINYKMAVEEVDEPIYFLPQKFILTYKTNNDGSRNKACIIDNYSIGNKVYERTQLENNKEYNETIDLKEGEYKLLFTDSDCDGLSWWANREQGNGYVYIYNEDKSKLLEAFEPDFGCKIDYEFYADNLSNDVKHKKSKLIKVPDTKAKTYTFVVFLKDGVEEELTLEIKNRKTKEVVSITVYPKADRFLIVYDYSVLPKGSYEARVSTNSWSETRAFS
ncbi:MAG: peptide-N-glycosidase F-related protein, partial [Bacteroidaceae bacterium]|nr:peptide-N-glycosidase F-related protein [Bacteroidaceae bacterium]